MENDFQIDFELMRQRTKDLKWSGKILDFSTKDFPNADAAIVSLNKLIEQAHKKIARLTKCNNSKIASQAKEYKKQLEKSRSLTDITVQEDYIFLEANDFSELFSLLAEIDKLNEEYEKTKSTEYSPLLQGIGTNALAHASKKAVIFDPITGIANIETREQVLIKIEKFADQRLNVAAKQLLDILTLKMTARISFGEKVTAEHIRKYRVVTLTVEEFMKIRALKDAKEARKQLEEAARTLYSLSLEWDERHMIIPHGKKRAKETILHHRMRIADNTISDFEKPIKNGAIEFKFSFDLAEYLCDAYVMPYPHALFTINSHNNPHSYYLGRKLALHHNMNIAKENANRISVQSLLDACPEMPTYDEIMKNSKDGHVMQKIRDPFDRDMDALIEFGILRSWEYCNSGGLPLTEEQLANYSYEVWASLLVDFELANYPDQTERIKKIERRKKIAAKKTEK